VNPARAEAVLRRVLHGQRLSSALAQLAEKPLRPALIDEPKMGGCRLMTAGSLDVG